MLCSFSFCVGVTQDLQAQTWDEWFKQRATQRKYLIEQIVKLQIYLGYLKKGYDIARTGMDWISSLKEGDLTLHTLFFDHQKRVNPLVSENSKVTDMIRLYSNMFKLFKSATNRIRKSKFLTDLEIDTIDDILTNMLNASSDDIDHLTALTTDYNLQMSDDERLHKIEELYYQVLNKHNSLYSFVAKVDVIIQQRTIQLRDNQTLENLYLP